MKNLTKNKISLFLLIFLIVSTIGSFLLVSIAATNAANDADQIAEDFMTELNKALTEANGAAVNIGQPGPLMTAYIGALVIGIFQLIALIGLGVVTYKSKSFNALMISVVLIIFTVAMYNIVAPMIKMMDSLDVKINKGTIADPDLLENLENFIIPSNTANWITAIFGTLSLTAVGMAGFAMAKAE